MTDCEDGKNVLRRATPEPGRPLRPPKTERVIVEKEAKVDVDAIANAVVKAIGNKMPVSMHGTDGRAVREDDFDSSKTLERLADTMSVQGTSSESNFEDLGKIKKTKKDVQSTIDLLSDIDEGE